MRVSLEDRVKRYVDVRGPDDCWEWKKYVCPVSGYGRVNIKELNLFYAHRMAWIVANGPIPEGLYVLHKCDNRRCCNPSHLWLGTYKDNAVDMEKKGRGKRQPNFPHLGHLHGNQLPHTKIPDEALPEVMDRRNKRADLAKKYGVKVGAIDSIRWRGRFAMRAARDEVSRG